MSETELTSEDKERIVRDVLETTISEQEYDHFEEQFAEEVSGLGTDTSWSRERMEKEVEFLFEGMPDASYSVEQVWVDDDTAIAHFEMEGTFENELTMPMDDQNVVFQPNGEETSFQGVYLFRFEDGQITEMNGFANELEWFQQLDIVPEFDELGEPAE